MFINLLNFFLQLLLLMIFSTSKTIASQQNSIALFGFRTKSHVVLSSTKRFITQGVLVVHNDYSWIHQIGEKVIVGLTGDEVDCQFVLKEIQKESELHQLMNFNQQLSPEYVARFVQRMVVDGKQIVALVGGIQPARVYFDDSEDNTKQSIQYQEEKTVLYYLDSYLSLKEIDYCAQGLEMLFLLSSFDHENRLLSCNQSVDGKENDGICGLTDEQDILGLVRRLWTRLSLRLDKSYNEVETKMIRRLPVAFANSLLHQKNG
jgi:20S proteasome alpha/beta subunit